MNRDPSEACWPRAGSILHPRQPLEIGIRAAVTIMVTLVLPVVFTAERLDHLQVLSQREYQSTPSAVRRHSSVTPSFHMPSTPIGVPWNSLHRLSGFVIPSLELGSKITRCPMVVPNR